MKKLIFYLTFTGICAIFITGCEMIYFPAEKNLPAGKDAHTEAKGFSFHKPGYKTPFAPESGCSSSLCHRSDLRGGVAFVEGKERIAPSCYQCHGAEWENKD